MLSQHALQVVSQHALQQVLGVSAPGGVCLGLWPSVMAFCYGLLVWPSGMAFSFGGLVIEGGLLVGAFWFD